MNESRKHEKGTIASLLIVISFIVLLYLNVVPQLQTTRNDTLQTFPFLIAVLTGILISLSSQIIWNLLVRPSLNIESMPRVAGSEPAIHETPSWKRAYYHLRVKNSGKSPAFNCRIRMNFYDSEGVKKFEISGKWDRGSQPLVYQWVPKKWLQNGTIESEYTETPNDFLIPFSESIDLYPSDSESFGFIVKYDDDPDCYGFSAWGYLRFGLGHRIPEWKLSKGTHFAKVTLTYSSGSTGRKFSKEFKVENLGRNLDSVAISDVKK
ncbi:MAG: hypothetical protein M1402_03620 [Candidatus Thermoplasmatota archaeon]|nr:hypothetical protein [Candidatus Thermoplasmatota archaeon]